MLTPANCHLASFSRFLKFDFLVDSSQFNNSLAAMSDCMWNLKYIRDSLRGSAAYIRAQNGGKTAFICADASQAVRDKAEKFLE